MNAQLLTQPVFRDYWNRAVLHAAGLNIVVTDQPAGNKQTDLTYVANLQTINREEALVETNSILFEMDGLVYYGTDHRVEMVLPVGEDGLIGHGARFVVHHLREDDPKPDEHRWDPSDLEIGHLPQEDEDFSAWRDAPFEPEREPDRIVYQGPRYLREQVKEEAIAWLKEHKMDVQSERERAAYEHLAEVALPMTDEEDAAIHHRSQAEANAWVVYNLLGENGFHVEALNEVVA